MQHIYLITITNFNERHPVMQLIVQILNQYSHHN